MCCDRVLSRSVVDCERVFSPLSVIMAPARSPTVVHLHQDEKPTTRYFTFSLSPCYGVCCCVCARVLLLVVLLKRKLCFSLFVLRAATLRRAHWRKHCVGAHLHEFSKMLFISTLNLQSSFQLCVVNSNARLFAGLFVIVRYLHTNHHHEKNQPRLIKLL